MSRVFKKSSPVIETCKNSETLKDNRCGGCGTFERVHDQCCEDCAEGYPEISEQEHKTALEYAYNFVYPQSKELS